MSTKSLSGFVVAMLATVVFAVGCQEPSDTGHDHDGHSHEHGEHGHVHGPNCDHSHGDKGGHDDHPAHGPNGGHLFDLDSDEFSCEWRQYQDNNVIRFSVSYTHLTLPTIYSV